MGPSSPNVVSWPQVPISSNFFKQNFGENEVLFVKIGASVLDFWPDTSSGSPQVAQM